ncbi:MAG: sigma 54-interacting transcriptional regulator [Deltaproteobacteria bacterium]|jgi:PAS domain S-box-containing protein|nr:sigma 54-interacting transcriptional regulator [Deltaproteobacteria bacterium]
MEDKQQHVLENLTAGVYVLDGEIIRYANRALLQMLGYRDSGSVAGKKFLRMVHPGDRSLFEAAAVESDRDSGAGEVLVFRMFKNDGSILWVSGHHSGGREPAGSSAVGCLVDISELKNREAALSETGENYRNVLNDIEDGYLEYDLAGNALFCNDAVCRIFGVSREWLMGRNYRETTDEETANACYQAFNRVYLTGIPSKSFIFETFTRGGLRKILEYSISLKKDSKGTPAGFRSIVRDITDRKRAKADVMEHRNRLRAIFRSVKDAIITVDTDLRVIEVNQAAKTICGLETKQIIGKVFTEASSSCDHACHEVLLETLKRKSNIKGYQVECGNPQRPFQKSDLSCSPLMDKNGNFMGAVLVIRDITRLNELERALAERSRFQKIIGKSRPMQEIYKLMEDLADLETTVLITGDSGTGKELVARALHNIGSRAFKPFVTVNCSALAENLLESELFGHVKGAFTGAVKDARGRFETAHGGTIHLDEIGDISARIQLKLLRVLQEKEYERVGDSVAKRADVRIVASTNKNLKRKVLQGEFREDLYYRLKVVEIRLPPLRDRLEDVPLLVDHFIQKFNKTFNKQIENLSDEVLKVFMGYHWPGNIRELEHTIEHAFVLCHDSTIHLRHIPADIRELSITRTVSVEKTPDKDRGDIEAMLKQTDWNVAKSARLLGMGRRTLYRRIAKYRLERPSAHAVENNS